MNTVIAIDPGSERSALVTLEPPNLAPRDRLLVPNARVREYLASAPTFRTRLVIEYTPPYTLQATSNGRVYFPRQLLDTALETGRMIECWGSDDYDLLSRLEVKQHLLGRSTGTDADVSAALLDVYGFRSAREAKGTVKEPGPLFGIANDLWAALAVAVTYVQTQRKAKR